MSIFSFVRSHAALATGLVVVVIGISVVGGRVARRAAVPVTVSSAARPVQVVDANVYKEGTINVSMDGTVESVSQVDLKSQISAPLAVLNVGIGDYIEKGQIIAEFQNADIRAQLEQARASLKVAQGQQQTGAVSLQSAKQGTIDKIRDAYLKGYDAVSTQLDPILYNNDGNGGRLSSLITDTNLNSEITTLDVDLKNDFRAWNDQADTLSVTDSPDSILSAALASQKRLTKIDQLLGNISKALNDAAKYATAGSAASINSWKATVTAARSSISGASQGLTAASASLSASASSQGTTAVAQSSAAEAGLSNLQAQLAKTIIVAPISGRIAALPLRTGELASPGQLIATIVGGGGLQIKGYASDVDFPKLKLGSKATIQGSIQGTVSSIAPAVNQSNKKVEVRVSVTDTKAALVVGQNVRVSILAPSPENTSSGVYLLPIQSIKIVPGSAYVFTAGDDSRLVRHNVTLGAVEGGFVHVSSGITDDMKLVTPVYGLEEGQTVTIQ